LFAATDPRSVPSQGGIGMKHLSTAHDWLITSTASVSSDDSDTPYIIGLVGCFIQI
jgi:hypothetical protein